MTLGSLVNIGFEHGYDLGYNRKGAVQIPRYQWERGTVVEHCDLWTKVRCDTGFVAVVSKREREYRIKRVL